MKQQKEAFLFNGKKVKEGDKISWLNSDGVILEGVIERRKFDCAGKTLKKGTLFFWNPQFLIEDYFTADVEIEIKK